MNDYNEQEMMLNTYVIPENFVDTGKCFNGMFRTRNLIEGVVMAAPVLFIIFHLNITVNNKIVFGIAAGLSIVVLSLMGFNGDSLTEFISHYLFFRNKKRICRYNPRVKFEATPGYLTKSQYELPRDKALRILGELTHKDTIEDEVSSDIYNQKSKEFFTDDIGIVTKPDNMKSFWERYREKYEVKKQEREILKELKKLEKERAKQMKKAQQKGGK